MLVAFEDQLCSKLCRHIIRTPTRDVVYILTLHFVGQQWGNCDLYISGFPLGYDVIMISPVESPAFPSDSTPSGSWPEGVRPFSASTSSLSSLQGIIHRGLDNFHGKSKMCSNTPRGCHTASTTVRLCQNTQVS